MHDDLNSRSPAPANMPPPYYGFVAAGRRSDAGNSKDNCEDADPILQRLPDGRVFACVADGLGGYSLGYDGRSGGFIASRAVAAGAAEYFREHPRAEAAALTRFLFDKLRRLSEQKLPQSRIKGTLLRHRLASTLACMVIDENGTEEHSAVELFWIGDSRIYFLDETGLKLLTRDDCLVEKDAFDGVFEDSPMSKFLAASMDESWRINRLELDLPGPGIMIACTDGCTAYWKRPWDFELALVEAFREGGDWKRWLGGVKERVDAIRSDDASLVAHPVRIGDFPTFRKQILRGHRNSAAVTASKTAARGRISERTAWLQIYKPQYEQLLPRPAAQPAAPSQAASAGRQAAAATPIKDILHRLWPFN